jgi:ParB family chromosome partitioning protein
LDIGEKMTIAEKIAGPAEKAPEPGAPEKVGDKRRALGRGLDSLLPGRPRMVSPAAPAVISDRSMQPIADAPKTGTGQDLRDEVKEIELQKIDANPYQTRKKFDEAALDELARSISTNGLIQPIVVRPGATGRFVLVLGERRLRASKIAGKTTIAAIVRPVSNQHAAEMTVVENLLRQDLNCLEQATAFSRLSREFGLTQEQIGQRTGVSRESVANYLRVLRLPEGVQRLLAEGRLGFSEARVLLQISDPRQIELMADTAARGQLSVTALQQLVDKALQLNAGHHPPDSPLPPIDANVRAAQSELEKILGVRVKITDRKGRGKIVIEYSNLDDFDRVMEMLKGDKG